MLPFLPDKALCTFGLLLGKTNELTSGLGLNFREVFTCIVESISVTAFLYGGLKGSGCMETEGKIVYWEEIKGISIYGGQAGDLDSQHWVACSDGYFLKERKKSWIEGLA